MPSTSEFPASRSVGVVLVCGLIIAYDVASAAWIGANFEAIRAGMPSLPAWALGASVAAGLVRAAGAAGVLAFRRWGFALVVAGAVARVALELLFAGGFDVAYGAFMTVLVVAVLFGLLVKGGDASAWSRMR